MIYFFSIHTRQSLDLLLFLSGLYLHLALKNHQWQSRHLLHLYQLPPISTQIIEKIADLCATILLCVVLRELSSQRLGTQRSS